MSFASRRQQTQQGLTLIEVLIALIVLSIGLLSIATLQLRSLQYSQSSFERSIAVMQANDLVERMWAGTCQLYTGPENNRVLDGDVLDAITAAWQQDHAGDVSDWAGLVADASSISPGVFAIDITWTDMHDESVEHVFTYRAKVPDLGCD